MTIIPRHNEFLLLALAKAIYVSFDKAENEILASLTIEQAGVQAGRKTVIPAAWQKNYRRGYKNGWTMETGRMRRNLSDGF